MPSPFKNMARLTTIASQSVLSNGGEGNITLYLPHLPEDIELPRENTYSDSGSNQAMPDGLWIYQYTNPLEIGLAFTLHAYDPLCVNGAKTLLEYAAKLHSLMLPTSGDILTSNSSAISSESQQNQPSQELQQRSGLNVQSLSDNSDSVNLTPTTSDIQLKYPPACSLRLIQAGTNGFGINCVGFVKSVNTVLHGPYRQTVNESEAYNLPSSITYNFTFVHNPSYTNVLGSGNFVNAYSPDIYRYFYNTKHLTSLSENQYYDVETTTS